MLLCSVLVCQKESCVQFIYIRLLSRGLRALDDLGHGELALDPGQDGNSISGVIILYPVAFPGDWGGTGEAGADHHHEPGAGGEPCLQLDAAPPQPQHREHLIVRSHRDI